jgi:hypothetical protein
LNPHAGIMEPIRAKRVVIFARGAALHRRCILAAVELQLLMIGWHKLPKAVQSAIAILVRANVADLPEAQVEAQCVSNTEDVAMQIARGCRYII